MNEHELVLYNKFKDNTYEEFDWDFLHACEEGKLDVVKFLLSSPHLKQHPNIHYDNDRSFISACKNGHLKIVEYLLTSPDLKDHADIHAGNDAGFRLACENNHMPVIQYLIFDCNIEKTARITKYLKEKSNEKIENMFKVRDLNQNLEKELSSDKVNQKKIKL